MRERLFPLLLVICLSIGLSTSCSPDFETVKAAYEKGNYATALVSLKPLVEKGNGKAQNLLGVMYLHGHGVVQDYSEAAKLFSKAADGGLPEAQANLGALFYLGQGVAIDYDEAIKWLKKAAEQGYVAAQLNLGIIYGEGKAVTQDYAEALKWFRMAAEQGDATAQYNVAAMYRVGKGITQDYAEALKWFRMAADQGLALAQNDLGFLYDKGQGVAQDCAEAVKWYRKAAEQGLAVSQRNLGVFFDRGQGVAQDRAEAFRWYLIAAEQGDATAQNNLAILYQQGEGVAQDHAEAFKWHMKAAEQGDTIAQNNLAALYEQGKGVAQDYSEAFKWYLKAAEQGDVAAQCNVAVFYRQGKGVAQDYAEAFRWFLKAAQQGFTPAQYNVGILYKQGKGVAQDYAEALKWFIKATEQGHADAINNVGVAYYLGQGVPKNYTEALKWFQKAADQSYAGAQLNLGIMNYKGEGLPRDYVKAYVWVNLAAAQGQEDAVKLRQELTRIMTADQVAQAQEMSRNWQPKAPATAEKSQLASVPNKQPSVLRLTPNQPVTFALAPAEQKTFLIQLNENDYAEILLPTDRPPLSFALYDPSGHELLNDNPYLEKSIPLVALQNGEYRLIVEINKAANVDNVDNIILQYTDKLELPNNVTKNDQRNINGYEITILIAREDMETCLIIKHDGQLRKVLKAWGEFYFLDDLNHAYSDDDRESALLIKDTLDKSGDGIPDIAVVHFSGGAHCCFSILFFELGEVVKGISPLSLGSARIYAIGKNPKGGLLFGTYDNSFAYWLTSFAESPMPKVILYVQGGAFRPNFELMKMPAPSLSQVGDMAIRSRSHFELEPYKGYAAAEPRFFVPVFWDVMLDLIYTGHEELAWQYFDSVWPSKKPGKAIFKEDFKTQLSSSQFWKMKDEIRNQNINTLSMEDESTSASFRKALNHWMKKGSSLEPTPQGASSSKPDDARPVNTWKYYSKADEMRGISSDLAVKTSENTRQNDSDAMRLSIVLVRTPNKESTVMLVLNRSQYSVSSFPWCAGGCRIYTKFDDEEVKEWLTVATEKCCDEMRVLLAKDFISKMNNAKRVIIEVPINLKNPEQFTFNLEGLVWDNPSTVQPIQPASISQSNHSESHRIRSAISDYFNAVANKNVDSAISMYASESKSKINRNALYATAIDTDYYRIDRLDVLHVQDNRANVIVFVYHKKHNAREEYWEIKISLNKEGGDWKIFDTPGRKIR